jgi:hypothetical protein
MTNFIKQQFSEAGINLEVLFNLIRITNIQIK